MRQKLSWSLAAALAATSSAAGAASPPETRIPDAAMATVAQLRETALHDRTAWDAVESLTTEVGPRLAGSEADARAVAWAEAKFRALGYDKVWRQEVTFPKWERRDESGAVLGAHAQPLHLTALGGSPGGTVEGEVVRFADLAALEAAKPESIEGKIVFLDEKMARSQDGSTYGVAVVKRRRCPILARERKAAACLIRTVGTSPQRVANTGNITSRESRIIPAAALSNPDSDELAYLLSKGPVRVRLDIGVETQADAPSGNVIAEIRGREKPHEIVLLGAHLDSWDITPGAHDDGTGVGTMMASAKLIADLPGSPRRTIRIVLFGSEETGLIGGMAYAREHKDELKDHVLASESDFGGETLWRMRTKFGPAAAGYARAMQAAVADLNIPLGDPPAAGESEVGLLAAQGVPVFDLDADGTNYFDVHHTPNDVISSVDPAALRQNVAAYATLAYIAAESDWDFRAK